MSQDTQETVAVAGLGYVGLPLAVEFAKHGPVIGYEIDEEKLRRLQAGIDPSGEVEQLAGTRIQFTADPSQLARATVIVVAVPTPLTPAHQPDLSYLEAVSRTIGAHLRAGQLVVYESTVYPGCTEEVCLPLLEAVSRLRVDADFHLAYSPERVNPGDRSHGVGKITKVVAGHNAAALDRVATLYARITEVHRAPSIQVAEASKVVENIQRNVNIALVNEFSLIFHRLGLDTRAVLEAASTKWNFHPYRPGLVGGYCIPVSPYYLTYRASRAGCEVKVIGAGLAVNDYLGRFLVREVVTRLREAGRSIVGAKVLLLGLTFKAGVADHRHSRAQELIRSLNKLKATVVAHEPLLADAVVREHFAPAVPTGWPPQGGPFDVIILFAKQPQFEALTLADLRTQSAPGAVLVDLTWRFSRRGAVAAGFTYIAL